MKRADLKYIRKALRNVNTQLRKDTSIKGAVEIKNIRDRQEVENNEEPEDLEAEKSDEEFGFTQEKGDEKNLSESDDADDSDQSLISVDVNRV
jgi:hypothetical protein